MHFPFLMSHVALVHLFVCSCLCSVSTCNFINYHCTLLYSTCEVNKLRTMYTIHSWLVSCGTGSLKVGVLYLLLLHSCYPQACWDKRGALYTHLDYTIVCLYAIRASEKLDKCDTPERACCDEPVCTTLDATCDSQCSEVMMKGC